MGCDVLMRAVEDWRKPIKGGGGGMGVVHCVVRLSVRICWVHLSNSTARRSCFIGHVGTDKVRGDCVQVWAPSRSPICGACRTCACILLYK